MTAWSPHHEDQSTRTPRDPHHRAIRIAVRRGLVTYGLAGTPEVAAATDAGWVRRDNRCRVPTFRPTKIGRAWLAGFEAMDAPAVPMESVSTWLTRVARTDPDRALRLRWQIML